MDRNGQSGPTKGPNLPPLPSFAPTRPGPWLPGQEWLPSRMLARWGRGSLGGSPPRPFLGIVLLGDGFQARWGMPGPSSSPGFSLPCLTAVAATSRLMGLGEHGNDSRGTNEGWGGRAIVQGQPHPSAWGCQARRSGLDRSWSFC